MSLDVIKTELLIRPERLLADSKIGAVLLIYLQCPKEESVFLAIETLLKHPCVISAEPDYYMDSHINSAPVIPNDRYFEYLWGMNEIAAPFAWALKTGSEDVSVGVLDSGIDYDHPDLKDNIAFALSEQNLFGLGGSQVYDSPMDETGHGTHVAGTIGAVGNNTIGVTGVCWRIKLASLKIGGILFNLASALKAIEFASKNKLFVLNSSWGSPAFSQALKFAIDHFDGVFVASAGNSGTDNDVNPVYPSSLGCENLISVAAIDKDYILAPFSNFGAASVHIAAPGVDILSTDLNSTYSYMDGTSMAAPHVAGAAALLKSFDASLNPREVKSIILSSVELHASLDGKVLSAGALNLKNMLEIASKLKQSKTK